jgi:AraC-like DNA-binding protein
LTAPGADAVGQPSIELIRAVITTHVDAAELASDSLHATLQLRVLQYLRAHLADPDLSAAEVAAEHHISVRQLYKVLAEAGVTPGDWLRTRRLEECRTELRNPLIPGATIESIARRWGFTDMSSFSRAFRSAYGMSPREWRRQTQFDNHEAPPSL